MSEYQFYEFVAMDEPLDEAEQNAVREFSSHANITATRFVNEYHGGDFRGDAVDFMMNYYDAHLYVANWGTRRLMLRLSRDLLNPDVIVDYCIDIYVNALYTDDSAVLDFLSDDEEGRFDYNSSTWMESLVGVRAELAAGDLRPLYLAWLAAFAVGEIDEGTVDDENDGDLEPPVPPGLGALTAAQRALAEFLRLDEDLLAIAAQASPPITAQPEKDLAPWIAQLPPVTKDQLLQRVMQGEAARVRAELRSNFQEDIGPTPSRRTVTTLVSKAAHRKAARQLEFAIHRTKERAHQEQPIN